MPAPVRTSDLNPKDKELPRASLALAVKLRATPMPLAQSKLDASASGVPKHDHDFHSGEPGGNKGGVGERGCNISAGKVMPRTLSAIPHFSPGPAGRSAVKVLSQPLKDDKTFASLLGVEKPSHLRFKKNGVWPRVSEA